MKYLITGGCGFLGSNLAHEIISKHDDLVIVDNLSRFGSSQNLLWLQSFGKFEFVNGDIRNNDLIDSIISKEMPEVIFHLAGQVAMTTSIQDPRQDFEINALGTLNMLEAVRKFSPNSILIYSSTNKVYGDLEGLEYIEKPKRYELRAFPMGLPENTPLNFSSPYGCSKGSADQYMLDYHRIFGLKTVVFRHSSMYGGRQFSSSDQGWIGWFCEQAINALKHNTNAPFTISGNGKQVRDVLYAEDMVNLYLTAANKIEQIKGEVFNIGGGFNNSLSLLELFDILESELSTKLNYNKIATRACDQKVFVADISKAEKMIGWHPQIDSLTGIRKMLEWIKIKN